ncbi:MULTISPECIES: GMC family oxidoreductase N-terminal domain-containing protein [unclassified Shinella]|uniref:GMC family oxidoreductase N-terminal domain-containing protein n=1 Tax=unclassified Shinella TaxID=2643062 RepID=UPI0012FAE1E1
MTENPEVYSARGLQRMSALKEFDYIVVGSGSAGCPLTARLLEKKNSVLLVEAGKKERLNLTHIPAALVHTIGNKRYDWDFQTQPDPTRDNLVEKWPRGRVPGGSSAINGMIFIRGAAKDYDAWEAMGNKGWGWNSVLPYFRKMETADNDKDNALRGGLGPALETSGLRGLPRQFRQCRRAAQPRPQRRLP